MKSYPLEILLIGNIRKKIRVKFQIREIYKVWSEAYVQAYLENSNWRARAHGYLRSAIMSSTLDPRFQDFTKPSSSFIWKIRKCTNIVINNESVTNSYLDRCRWKEKNWLEATWSWFPLTSVKHLQIQNPIWIAQVTWIL